MVWLTGAEAGAERVVLFLRVSSHAKAPMTPTTASVTPAPMPPAAAFDRPDLPLAALTVAPDPELDESDACKVS